MAGLISRKVVATFMQLNAGDQYNFENVVKLQVTNGGGVTANVVINGWAFPLPVGGKTEPIETAAADLTDIDVTCQTGTLVISYYKPQAQYIPQ